MPSVEYISDHAYMRARERLSFNRKTLERMSEKALNEGLSHCDLKGSLKKYVDSLYFEHGARKLKFFGEHIFVFSTSNTLITVLELPQKYKNKVITHKRKRTLSV